MICVAKAVIENNGKYLLLKINPNEKFFSGQWNLLGGKVNNETAEESLIREVKEETSLDVMIEKLLFLRKLLLILELIFFQILVQKKLFIVSEKKNQ